MPKSPSGPLWHSDRPVNRFKLPEEVDRLSRHLHVDSDVEWVAAEDASSLLGFNEASFADSKPQHWIPEVARVRLDKFQGKCSFNGGCYSVRSVGFLFASRFPNAFMTESVCCNPTTSNPSLCSFKAMARRAFKYVAEINQWHPTDVTRLMLDCHLQGDCALSELIVFKTFLMSLGDSGSPVRLDGDKLVINRFEGPPRRRGRPPADKDYPGRTVAYRPTKKPKP